MKLQSSKEDILKGISIVQNAISTKTTLPILSNLLLETIDNKLKITGTDLDIGIITYVNVKIMDEGSITLPAKKFMDIIKELPESPVTISVRKNNMVNITCEKTQFKVMGIPRDDFPSLPQLKDEKRIEVKQGVLRDMLAMTSFAMSRDETRYVLNGVYMLFKKDRVRLVATDGRRLALIERPIKFEKGMDRNIIIPLKTVQELHRTLKDDGNLVISIGGNQAMFDLGESIIISRLIEGEFPNYEQVIPKEVKEKVVVDREKLLLATKRASILTSHESQGIKMDIDKGRMVISKQSPDIGEAREELDVEYKGSPFSIGFNPNYIIDALKNINQSSLGFELENPEKPGVIRIGDNYVYVVLPMQLA